MRHLFLAAFIVAVPASTWAQPYLTANVGQFRESGDFFDGATRAFGGAVGTFLTPRISVELDVARPGAFETQVAAHAPVDISDAVRQTLAPGELQDFMGKGRTETAGRVAYSVAVLVGFHPKARGRVRVGLRAGIGLQHLEWSQTYDVVVVTDPPSYELRRQPAGSNDRVGVKLVLGVETAISVARHLSVVPELKVNIPLRYSDSALRPAIGVRWSF